MTLGLDFLFSNLPGSALRGAPEPGLPQLCCSCSRRGAQAPTYSPRTTGEERALWVRPWARHRDMAEVRAGLDSGLPLPAGPHGLWLCSGPPEASRSPAPLYPTPHHSLPASFCLFQVSLTCPCPRPPASLMTLTTSRVHQEAPSAGLAPLCLAWLISRDPHHTQAVPHVGDFPPHPASCPAPHTFIPLSLPFNSARSPDACMTHT